jgi:hypothetical protein
VGDPVFWLTDTIDARGLSALGDKVKEEVKADSICDRSSRGDVRRRCQKANKTKTSRGIDGGVKERESDPNSFWVVDHHFGSQGVNPDNQLKARDTSSPDVATSPSDPIFWLTDSVSARSFSDKVDKSSIPGYVSARTIVIHDGTDDDGEDVRRRGVYGRVKSSYWWPKLEEDFKEGLNMGSDKRDIDREAVAGFSGHFADAGDRSIEDSSAKAKEDMGPVSARTDLPKEGDLEKDFLCSEIGHEDASSSVARVHESGSQGDYVKMEEDVQGFNYGATK